MQLHHGGQTRRPPKKTYLPMLLCTFGISQHGMSRLLSAPPLSPRHLLAAQKTWFELSNIMCCSQSRATNVSVELLAALCSNVHSGVLVLFSFLFFVLDPLTLAFFIFHRSSSAGNDAASCPFLCLVLSSMMAAPTTITVPHSCAQNKFIILWSFSIRSWLRLTQVS